MPKKYDQPITPATDWGGDASTGYKPVTGRRVQEHIKGRFASAEGEITNLRGATIGLRTDVDSANESIGSLRTEVDTVRRTTEGHTTSIGELRRELTEVGGDVETNGGAIAQLQESLSATEARVSATEIGITAETAARERLAADVSDIRDMAETAGRQVDDLLDWRPDVNEGLGSLNAEKLDKTAIVTLSEEEYEGLAEKDPEKYYYTYED